jgi:hypothetical protein
MGIIGDGSMYRWIDTDTIDRYYRSLLLVMLTTDSIDPSVKDFFALIDSIDHRSKNPDQNITIDPSVHIQPMVAIHKPGNILQYKAVLNTLRWLKGTVSKDLWQQNC